MPYANICHNASGELVRDAFANLGPVENFGDILNQQGEVNRATMLAANQIVHLVEGWRYFSSAMFAFTTHSPGNSLHFAYYAELRAAFSLLAYSGIWTKPYHLYCLDGAGAVHHEHINANGGSHIITWKLWNEWQKRNDARELILQGVSLPNKEVTLETFIPHLGGTPAISGIKKWGYDLLRPNNDRDARNTYSYQPYWSERSLSKMSLDDFKFMQSIWKYIMTETGSQWGFDSALIKNLLDRRIDDMASDDSFDDSTFDKDSWLNQIFLLVSQQVGIPADEIRNMLMNNDIDTSLFAIAGEELEGPKNVISRALFMLRLATLALQKNLRTTSNADSATKWIKHWSDHAGLWSEDSGIQPLDLLSDYEDSVYGFTPSGKLPHALFGNQMNANAMRLCRPDVCLTWNLFK
ncbi:MAG TPA: hypothetical protein VJ987_12255 [Anaerolineales bacterium]|nr:hypothetical protein [Anaerolineales bacterium]